MSKVLSIYRGARIARMDCGHTIDRIRPFTWDYGDEVVCPTCEDTSKQVKAARREALEEACKAECSSCVKDFDDVIKIDRGTWEHKTEEGHIIHCFATRIRNKLLADSP